MRFYLGDPGAGGVLLGTGTIPFLGPNGHGSTTAVAWTPDTAGDFQLYAVIDPENAAPEADEQNNVVQRPFTILPVQPDTEPPVVTAFTIDGGASTTANRNVRLDVVASDQGNPAGGVAGVYFVEYQWDMTLGIWKRILFSPIWQFYPTQTGSQADATPATFGWQLAAVPGMRYLQVWAVDAAGNISVSPQQAYINYVPDTLQVAGGDAAILRFPLAASDRIRVRIEPVSGDPDVYLWAPDATDPASPAVVCESGRCRHRRGERGGAGCRNIPGGSPCVHVRVVALDPGDDTSGRRRR